MIQDERLNEMLWNIVNNCVPEVSESEEYKAASSEIDAYRMYLEARLTEEGCEMLREFEAENNHLISMVEDLAYRKIYFFGLGQGIEMSRRMNKI
jgi:hypothetical protein